MRFSRSLAQCAARKQYLFLPDRNSCRLLCLGFDRKCMRSVLYIVVVGEDVDRES